MSLVHSSLVMSVQNANMIPNLELKHLPNIEIMVYNIHESSACTREVW